MQFESEPERFIWAIAPMSQKSSSTFFNTALTGPYFLLNKPGIADMEDFAPDTVSSGKFWTLFWIWKLDRFSVDPAQRMVQTRDRFGASSLVQLDPEHHQAGVGVSAAHILDAFISASVCWLGWLCER